MKEFQNYSSFNTTFNFKLSPDEIQFFPTGYSGEPWSGIRLNGRSPSSTRLPRVTLERSALRQRTVIESDRLSFGDDEDKPYCPATYCRPIPRSAWMDFRELTTDILENTRDDDESSDEAYSEDYVHSEEQDELPLEVMSRYILYVSMEG